MAVSFVPATSNIGWAGISSVKMGQALRRAKTEPAAFLPLMHDIDSLPIRGRSSAASTGQPLRSNGHNPFEVNYGPAFVCRRHTFRSYTPPDPSLLVPEQSVPRHRLPNDNFVMLLDGLSPFVHLALPTHLLPLFSSPPPVIHQSFIPLHLLGATHLLENLPIRHLATHLPPFSPAFPFRLPAFISFLDIRPFSGDDSLKPHHHVDARTLRG
ncbi:hypothetical protein C8R45DRAFT_1096003 [Mycena sanguinolenta]|nr:hypothetical protein C8R45DRAFT_1096003 [Mycena sanguinolenta]